MFSTSVLNTEIGDNIEEALKFAQAHSFDAIDIQNAWGKNIEMLEKDELYKLGQLVNDHKLKVPCISSTLFLRNYLDDLQLIAPEIKEFPALSGNYDDHIKSLQQALIAAQILESPCIRVFGFQTTGLISETTFIRAAENFKKPVELAKRAGITLAMENCPYTPFAWGINAVKLIKMINSPVFQLLWDPANSIRSGEPNCIQAMSDITSLVAHVHAKDLIIFPDGHRRYLPVGQGIVPWKTIFQELRNTNYDGAVSFEPHFVDGTGSKKGAILESRISMENIISNIL